MDSTVLIVPGYHGSGPGHWQTWLESELVDARRVRGIDWERPVLADWALEIRREIDESVGPVWIVAHSFGCLASVVAAADRIDKVAGALLVAPADPERFTPTGARAAEQMHFRRDSASVASLLPVSEIPVMGMVVASATDPWMALADARFWALRWGFAIQDAGDAGHINTESGHGAWPAIRNLLSAMRLTADNVPLLGSLCQASGARRGRGSALANARKFTRKKVLFQ